MQKIGEFGPTLLIKEEAGAINDGILGYAEAAAGK
jgi:hypothetical protein